MATDIAFALGVLSLLGDRVPAGLKVFLAAVAIVDDIGAVLVIAIWYSGAISLTCLTVGAVIFACMWADSWPDCTWSGCFCHAGAATVSTRASGATTGNRKGFSNRERGGEAQAFSCLSTHFSTRIG